MTVNQVLMALLVALATGLSVVLAFLLVAAARRAWRTHQWRRLFRRSQRLHREG